MDSNEYFEKTYLDYYFLKEVLNKDKQYHIEGFVKNDLSEESEKNIDEINILSILLKYLIDHLPKKTQAVVSYDNIDVLIHKGYKSLNLNKQYKFISNKTNQRFINTIDQEIVLNGFIDNGTKIFDNVSSLSKKKYYYEIDYSSKTLLSDIKQIIHNIQIYNINYIIHKCKIDQTKLFFTNEKYNKKNNKTYKVLEKFNDVLKYKLIEEYDNSSYSAFFNSHLEYLYEIIIIYNSQNIIDDEINKIKFSNNIIEQKISFENETIKNTLNTIVIKNLTKQRFPNLFNSNHKECLFRSDKEFSIDILPKKYKDVVLLEHKKNQQYISQVVNNKCEHTKISLKSKNITEYYQEIDRFIDNDYSENEMIPCKICKFDLICPHEYKFYQMINDKKNNSDQLFKQDKYENQVKQIITNMYSSDTSVQYKFYCKICGAFLDDDNNALDSFKSIGGSMSNASVRSVDDEIKKYIIKECFYIVSSYIDIERLDIEPKNIVWIITDLVIGQLSDINIKLSKKKLPPQDHDLLYKFHLKLVIFTIIVLLINQTKIISFKKFDKTTNIKDILNQCFSIFVKYANSIITKMSIQYIDIKSLLIDYYKNIVNNTISFSKDEEVDISLKLLTNSINYKVLNLYLNLYMNVKTNDIDKILNKNIIQPNKKQKNQPKEENVYDSIKIETNNKSLQSNDKYKSLYLFVKNLKFGTDEIESQERILKSFEINYANIMKLPYSSIKFGLNDKKDIYFVSDKISKIDKKKFYNTYTYTCPVKGFHEYNDDDICSKCGINIIILNDMDDKYFNKYVNVYKKELDRQTLDKQSKIDKIVSNYKSQVIKKNKIDTTLNMESINIISNLFNIDEIFLIKLGSIEGMVYDVNHLKDFNIDNNERILKLINYMLYLAVEYNKFRSDKDISKKYPQITTNLIDMIDSYKNIMNSNELVNLILNTIYSNIIHIYNINTKDNSLFSFLDVLIHQIIQFDEVFSAYDYSSIKYLLRKSKNDDVIIDDSKFETNEVNEYEDLFGSDLFDESFDENNEDSDGITIKTSDH